MSQAKKKDKEKAMFLILTTLSLLNLLKKVQKKDTSLSCTTQEFSGSVVEGFISAEVSLK